MFDGSNYALWKKRMRAYLMYFSTNSWKSVVDGKKNYKHNLEVMNSILSGLSKSKFYEVILCKIETKLWDKLQNTYVVGDIEEIKDKENLKIDTAYEIRI